MRNLWPVNELEYLGCCPVCESKSRTLVYRDLTDKLFHCSNDRWQLHACGACGTHYLDPRPGEQSIGIAYTNYLTHEGSPTGGSDVVAGSPGKGVKGVLRAMANGYRNARWGMQLEPHLSCGRYLVPCIPPLRDALVQQMRSLPRQPGRAGARLLDVGCGNGAFLQLARSAGWSVQGTDFDGVAVATARSRGLDVRQGGLEVLQAAESGSFDWASLSHVLEHVHDPMAWLKELHRLLRQGGTLWLQTPNIGSVGHARYHENWRGLEPPRHLTLWTLDRLCQTLRQIGFRSARPLRTPILTAMELYASSEALQSGLDYAAFMALPQARRRRLRHVWPALRQYWSLRGSEFHTLIAAK
jgi:2-polyprenyl-3-methyl-5-hydroxy-6-metoxy-1,4-benzoquinol methylase